MIENLVAKIKLINGDIIDRESIFISRNLGVSFGVNELKIDYFKDIQEIVELKYNGNILCSNYKISDRIKILTFNIEDGIDANQ